MSNVLNTLGYSRFLKKRDEFTMNYSEVKSTFDTDIYSVLKSRQKFKVVEDAILDVGSEVVKDEKPLEVRDIVIKDMKLMNKEQRLEEKLGKKKEDKPKEDKKEDKPKEDKNADKPKEDKKDDKKEDKPKEDKSNEKMTEEPIEPKKKIIDDNEKEFLFSSKPKKNDPEEKKIENEATFQNETKEILQEDKYKKKIVITQDALEPPKEKSPRKKK